MHFENWRDRYNAKSKLNLPLIILILQMFDFLLLLFMNRWELKFWIFGNFFYME